MKTTSSYDAIVIGSGPNGLAAAIFLATRGYSVAIYEANETVGGGARSAELTLPGFTHDICSAVHPLAAASPFFRTLPLEEHGLEFIHSPSPLAHPIDDDRAVVLGRSLEETSRSLGGQDGESYARLMEPFVRNWSSLGSTLLAPLRFPHHPLLLSRFGIKALRSAQGLSKAHFSCQPARALFAGLSAHSTLPLEWIPSAAFGLVLGITGHTVGWPIPRGGAQKISDSLASYFRSIGGEIKTSTSVDNVDQLPRARVILCDITPRQLLKIAGHRFPESYRKKLSRYIYGPGAFKMDWALGGPIPWKAKECTRAATVHIGGTLEEIAISERAAWSGEHTKRPFVLLAQPSLFDPTRAPAGKHTAWAYCHVPNGSRFDMTDRLEGQIERFAPGFRDLILARNVLTPGDLEEKNGNLIGGDISGGAQTLRQLFMRPTLHAYKTPVKELYLCSSSTPPGGGVHGMCGFEAARRALSVVRGS